MSNPAVIQLAATYIGDTEVRIEDNFAEAIHLHYGALRIDLSVHEFLEMADRMAEAANQLIQVKDFDIRDFDPIFLNYYSSILVDLENITLDRIRLGDIIILKNYRLPCYRHLNQSRVYKALKGQNKELDAYKTQVNDIGQTNMERLNKMLESIQKNGYPYKNQYVILRNDQNVLLDGQHRASCLLYLLGKDAEIPVMRFHFKDKRHNVTDWHPWIKALLRKCIGLMRRVSHRLIGNGQIDI